MAKRIVRQTWITIAGTGVVLIGLVLLPLPGPGLLIIIAGLAILGTEFEWARRIMDPIKKRLEQAKDRLIEIKNDNQTPKDR